VGNRKVESRRFAPRDLADAVRSLARREAETQATILRPRPIFQLLLARPARIELAAPRLGGGCSIR
jgi:hypothetical protein